MSGQGKYTKYAIPADTAKTQQGAKNNLLHKMFGQNTDPAKLPPQMELGPGKEDDVRVAILKIGRLYMQGDVQPGDADHFPNGVDMSYGTAPDLTQVEWAAAGGPANAYVPDITSPGPGLTNGVDKDVDPQISTTDIKANYMPGADGTKNPSATSQGLTDATKLGNILPKGKSGV